jgi:AraC-like DNA-binding protein
MKPILSPAELPSAIAQRFLDRQATREVIRHLPSQSFRWIEHDYPSEIARWNFHPEYEIHLIRHGTGSFIIGDEVGTFGPGHVALIGPGLPHDWMSDVAPNEVILNRDVVIQFDDAWFTRCAQAMPELGDVRDVLDASGRGLVFSGETAVRAAEEMERMGLVTGTRRMSHLLTLLAILAQAPADEKVFIAREWFSSGTGREGALAVEAGLSYIFENLNSRIRMSEAARLALMSEPTFSKYFKKASGLTFSDMVKKLRIANACRLLERTDTAIASICLEVGYSNLANFNRQFLTEMKMTPSAYRNLDDGLKPRAVSPSLGLKSGAGYLR